MGTGWAFARPYMGSHYMDITTEPAPAEPTATPVPLPPERPEAIAAEAAPAVPAPAPAPIPVLPPAPVHEPVSVPDHHAPRPLWWNGTEAAAASQGVNSDTLWKIAGIESGFGHNLGSAAGSSASGPFQITDGTWNQIARLNPSLGLTDKGDLSQHGKAAAALLRANSTVLQTALGRVPTDGEQYLVWFGGTGAGVQAAKADPSTPVSAIFSPKAIASNPSILGNGMTVGGLRRWADAKMAGQHYTPGPDDTAAPAVNPMNNPSGGVGWNTLAPSMPYTESEKAILADRQNADVWSNTHAMAEAFDHENMVGQLWRAANVPTPDPNYVPTAAAIAADPRTKDIDRSHYAYLLDSQSDAEMGQRAGALRDELNYQQKMAQKGWGGTAMQTFASLWDPAGVALGMLSPVGAGAAKFGRIAQVIGAGVEGATISTGMEYAAPKPGEVDHSYLGAAAFGFLGGTLGGALGAAMHPHPEVAPAFRDMTDGAQSILDDVANGVPGRPFGGSTAGAAQNLGYVAPVRSDVADFTAKPFMDAELGNVAMKQDLGFLSTRFDLSGQTKGSENPLTAALGSRLVEDAVGNADHSAVNRAVSVEATMIRERQDTALARAYQDAWGDYRERNSVTVGQGREAEMTFREGIADAIDNVDPTQGHGIDPAITRAADAYRRNFGDFHELAQNPGLLDGSTMAPLKGMAEVERNPSYFPHIYDFLAFGEHVRRFGDAQMKGLLRDSILSHVPGMALEDAERLGSGLYKGLRNVQTGQEVSMSRMLSGDDQEGLRGLLAAETDMGADQINRIIAQLNPPKSEGTIGRTKRATPLNVHYEGNLRDVQTGETVPVKAKDFMERDAVRVGTMYNRQMAAQVALARLRVENPRWRLGDGPETPRLLVDGIRGPSEMETLLAKVRAVGDELGHKPEDTTRDVDRLQFIYDAITGRTSSGMDRGKLGQFVRLLKAWNFTRVMNQVGFAQMAEIWTGVAQVGIRAAMSSMPEFRQLLDGIRGGRGQTDLAMQLEHMASPGTDMLRGSMHVPMDDLHNAAGRTGAVMDRLEHGLHKATRATSILSGMAPLTTFQQKWMAKAALARFAMDATGEKVLNTKRMRVLGISEEEQSLIRDQLRLHDGYVEGESGTQHRVLNLDAWDPKARHALEYALHVWTRKMIQENDLGQMNMVLGSSMGRLMGQFRMFMLGAYTKNTLHNLHMRDFETLSGVLGSSVLGAATYAAQVHLQSIGRADRDQWLAKRLDTKTLAAAAISRGGYSSILPMVADLGTYALGFDPLFDTRVSGGAAQGITSNPTMGLANSVFDAARGIAGSTFRGEAYSQRDARALQAVMPFSNFLPVVWATNAMVGGLPNKDTHKHPN